MSVWRGVDPVWSPEWLWLGYATLLRATLVLMVIALAAWLLRRSPGSVRALLWATALVALIPLPYLRALPLTWSVHLVPRPLADPMIGIGALLVEQSSSAAVAVPWSSVVAAVWLAGVTVVLARLAAGWLAAGALVRRSRPMRDPRALALLHEASASLRIRRRVRLVEAPDIGTPLTWGTVRPIVLLPGGAAGWPEEHLRGALLHELAHVRRLDCALQLLGRAACAVWWFHPGAWWAARRLEAERELACDERVLAAGVRPSTYAECLLRLEGGARGGVCIAAALAGGAGRGRSRLAHRIRAVLAPGAVGRIAPAGVMSAAGAASVALVLVAGSMRLGAAPGALWSALDAPGWSTRAFAAESIARFGDDAARRRLDDAIRDDPHPAVRAMARFGMRLREAEPAPPLVRLGWTR